jgi:hypothetical protein
MFDGSRPLDTPFAATDQFSAKNQHINHDLDGGW